MKKYKISIQKGLTEIEDLLKREGHEVVYMGENDLNADITVMNGVDTVYEEIENAQCMYNGNEEHQMLVINATNLSPEKVLDMIRNNHC